MAEIHTRWILVISLIQNTRICLLEFEFMQLSIIISYSLLTKFSCSILHQIKYIDQQTDSVVSVLCFFSNGNCFIPDVSTFVFYKIATNIVWVLSGTIKTLSFNSYFTYVIRNNIYMTHPTCNISIPYAVLFPCVQTIALLCDTHINYNEKRYNDYIHIWTGRTFFFAR